MEEQAFRKAFSLHGLLLPLWKPQMRTTYALQLVSYSDSGSVQETRCNFPWHKQYTHMWSIIDGEVWITKLAVMLPILFSIISRILLSLIPSFLMLQRVRCNVLCSCRANTPLEWETQKGDFFFMLLPVTCGRTHKVVCLASKSTKNNLLKIFLKNQWCNATSTLIIIF